MPSPSIFLLLVLVFGDGEAGRGQVRMPTRDEAPKGRVEPLEVSPNHAALEGRTTVEPFPDGSRWILLGMGCFWGAERLLWQQRGVFSTQVGYSGGFTPNPTYEEVSTGTTGHAEVVRVIYDPLITSLDKLLKAFWENHDPTQGNRQGADVGTQYRSVIFVADSDALAEARRSLNKYQAALLSSGFGTISTEIELAGPFYYAEDYHQQYLHKNPGGYCGLGGLKVTYPDGAKTEL